MMPMRQFFMALLLVLSLPVFAQTPASATLETNRVKAVVNSNGALFTDFQNGRFIAPYVPGQPEISLLRAAGLWIAGLDPAGNLKGAAQTYNTGGSSDFIPGALDESGVPSGGLTDIYRVTAAEIAAHQADFADNGVIDNPRPGVFGWPGRGNPFFSQYHNGEELPFTPVSLAGFFDRDFDGTYDPAAGDFPAIEIRGCPLDRVPTEMLWFVFNDVAPHTQSGAAPMQMEIQCQVFAFDCTEESPLRNTVFLRYKLINRASERLDDVYFGLFSDFDTGNPGDDFFGCNTDRHLVFGYNGDNIDEGGYGSGAPALGVDVFRGPIDTFGLALPLAHVMPVDPALLINPITYYNLLRGRFADGTPAPNNGLFYPGDPNIPNSNSEPGVGSVPGQRRVLTSFGPFSLLPGALNEFIAGYFYTQEPGNTPLQNVAAMYQRDTEIQGFFDNCFEASNPVVCTPPVVSVASLPAHLEVNVFPNPATRLLTVQSEKSPVRGIQLTNLTGQTVLTTQQNTPQAQVSVSVEQLPAGVYFAEIRLANGVVGQVKVVVQKP